MLVNRALRDIRLHNGAACPGDGAGHNCAKSAEIWGRGGAPAAPEPHLHAARHACNRRQTSARAADAAGSRGIGQRARRANCARSRITTPHLRRASAGGSASWGNAPAESPPTSWQALLETITSRRGHESPVWECRPCMVHGCTSSHPTGVPGGGRQTRPHMRSGSQATPLGAQWLQCRGSVSSVRAQRSSISTCSTRRRRELQCVAPGRPNITEERRAFPRGRTSSTRGVRYPGARRRATR